MPYPDTPNQRNYLLTRQASACTLQNKLEWSYGHPGCDQACRKTSASVPPLQSLYGSPLSIKAAKYRDLQVSMAFIKDFFTELLYEGAETVADSYSEISASDDSDS